MITFEIKGLQEVERVLKEMPDQFNYKFLTAAHKKALKPFLNEAKRRAPVLGDSPTTMGKLRVTSQKYSSRSHEKGNLARAMTSGVAPRNRKMAAVWAGIKSRSVFRKGSVKPDAYYGSMVENGHYANGTYVPPRPFMRPAWEATKNQLKSEVSKAYIDRMKRLVKKYANVRG